MALDKGILPVRSGTLIRGDTTLTTVSAAALLAATTAGAAYAAPVTPTFQTFGDLAGATFGGAGIPTDPTAFSSFTMANGNILTLGLAATPRFSNPALGNDGAGTYTAQAGANDGMPGNPGTAATCNFSFFARITDATGSVGAASTSLDGLGVSLLYDLDPGAATDERDLGTINLGGFGPQVEGSQNASFGYLGLTTPGVNTAPAFTAFDPSATGEYSFALTSELGRVAINVNVAAVPVPAAGLMLLGGLGCWPPHAASGHKTHTTSSAPLPPKAGAWGKVWPLRRLAIGARQRL